MEDAAPDEGPADNSDVPFLKVCTHHHEALDPPPQSEVSQVYAPTESGGLSSTASAEDTLVESVNGEVFNITPEVDPRGRSQRKCVKGIKCHAF